MAEMTLDARTGSDPVDGLVRPATGWTDLDGAVRSIGLRALQANLGRADMLHDAVGLAASGFLDDRGRTAAIDAAHKLAGSAGTFGFPGASNEAAELERFFVRAVFDEQQLLTANDRIRALFAELATEPDF